jgi:single-strand selective monofunctional uracil DNA glycosylase
MSAGRLKSIYSELSGAVDRLTFGPPVTHVYNPLNYARKPVERYLELAGQGHKQIMFLGMNPGPWGMAQTGVPFGTVRMVRDWLGIHGAVAKPSHEHPKRPILGFEARREEVSGTRFWGWARDAFETPERFFAQHFVANYCPLVFMEETGRNRTPDKLPAAERSPLFECCNNALCALVDALQPELIIGVGTFAEDRARRVLGETGPRIARILHPSPASPAANRGWSEQAAMQLREITSTLDP